jgi:type IV secretory pathway TraG/TraD family ATPase VirD4
LIDELASLHKLPSLSLLLSQGSKYGLCAASAFQDIHQLRTIYGIDEAKALMAMYNTIFSLEPNVLILHSGCLI